MKSIFFLLFLFSCLQTNTQHTDLLAPYKWENRILIVCTDTPKDELYQTQIKIFESKKVEMKDRDLVTFHLFKNSGTNPEGNQISAQELSDIKERFNLEENSFTVCLIGKDGTLKLASENEVLKSKKLFSVIDAMPMRRREMQGQGKK